MPDAIIDIRGLSKRYGGRLAVEDLDLQVFPGEIFGFVGPNGAGKTSTIRMIATLLRPTAGEIRVAGNSIQTAPRAVRAALGYMPDFFGVYRGMRVWEYLDFFAACYEIPPERRATLVVELLELFELSHRRDDPVDRLSRGLQQRLSLARTLVHDPQILLLDEPASGLDPRARVEIRALLVELARMGKTIFFSTHILADVAEICTRVAIIEAGKLVAVDELETLSAQWRQQREVEITLLVGEGYPPVESAIALLEGLPPVEAVRTIERTENHTALLNHRRARLEVDFHGDDPALSGMLAALVNGGFEVVHFNENSRDLEAIFMQLTRGIVS